jgi:hypothetical protein
VTDALQQPQRRLHYDNPHCTVVFIDWTGVRPSVEMPGLLLWQALRTWLHEWRVSESGSHRCPQYQYREFSGQPILPARGGGAWHQLGLAFLTLPYSQLLFAQQDKISMHPSQFGRPPEQALNSELNEKYANRILHDVGLWLCVATW